MENPYRRLPSVNALLRALEHLPDSPATALPWPVLSGLAAAFLDERRAAIRHMLENGAQPGQEAAPPAGRELEEYAESLLRAFARRVEAAARPNLRPVLNATGVVLHTNLGRAPLAEEAVRALTETAARASNLELDLNDGERGSRYSHVDELLRMLTGAESSLVVNNNAAAVLLTLDTLCAGGEVPVSRGELVEIGGNFRIPEIMEKGGAHLREVGTTNRTVIEDYEKALNENTRALLRVHTSNYRIVGFTAGVPRHELARLAKSRDLPLIEDLGSGSLVDFTRHGLPVEPTVAEVLADGADVVTFSGDKLLGGPQAGIICGSAEYISRIRKNPLNRALRVDKLTLAALEATLRLYLDPGAALERIPALRMITMEPDVLERRARRLERLLKRVLGPAHLVRRQRGTSAVGGGSFPAHDLPAALVSVSGAGCSAETLRRRLLDTTPPLLGRVERDLFLLDPRTLRDDEFAPAAEALAQALGVLTDASGSAGASVPDAAPAVVAGDEADAASPAASNGEINAPAGDVSAGVPVAEGDA